MPYKLQKNGSKYYVIDDEGKRYSEKPMPKWRAQAQMRALYASEQKARLLKDGLPASAYLVVEDPQKVTTWHLAVLDAAGKPDHRLMGAAWAALHGGYRGNKYEGPGKTEALARLKRLYADEKMPLPGEKSFRVFKQADGSYRWVTFSSSAFRDRDGEVVTAKALEAAVSRMDESGNHGPLRWWHVGAWEYPDGPESWQTWTAGKGIDLGTCDFSMVYGRMLVESGAFKDATTGKAFSEAADNLEVSIAFSHPPDEPGEQKEFSNIHIFERSLLPAGMASNLLTRFYVNKEGETMKAAQKLQALAAILRDKPDVVKQILADAESVEKAAETAGLEFKEVAAMFAGDASETEETAPTTEEVIQSPEPAAEPPAPEPAAKQAPEAEEEEEDMIGEMSHADLVGVIRQVVSEVIAASAEQGKAKEQADAQLLADLAAAQKGALDRIEQVEAFANQTKQDLLELTDARPAGVKQLHTQRATERQDNVVKKAPTGPTIDPEFLRFATGGK